MIGIEKLNWKIMSFSEIGVIVIPEKMPIPFLNIVEQVEISSYHNKS